MRASHHVSTADTPGAGGTPQPRQRIAAGLLTLAGIVSLGTLLFPWTHYYHVGATSCPTCELNQNIPVADFGHALANGASLTTLTLAALAYAGIPLAFAGAGVGLFLSRQPARIWWKVLLILFALLFLALVLILQQFAETSPSGLPSPRKGRGRGWG